MKMCKQCTKTNHKHIVLFRTKVTELQNKEKDQHTKDDRRLYGLAAGIFPEPTSSRKSKQAMPTR